MNDVTRRILEGAKDRQIGYRAQIMRELESAERQVKQLRKDLRAVEALLLDIQQDLNAADVAALEAA